MDTSQRQQSNRLWLTNHNTKNQVNPAPRKYVPPPPGKRKLATKGLSDEGLSRLRGLWLEYASDLLKKQVTRDGRLNLLQRMELAGAEARVVRSKNPSHLLIKGVLVDETAKTVVIQVEGRLVTVSKPDVHLEICCPNGERMIILGNALQRSVVTRTKAKAKLLRSLELSS